MKSQINKITHHAFSWLSFGLLAGYALLIPLPYVFVLWRIEHEWYYYVFTSLTFHWADLFALSLLALGAFASFWPKTHAVFSMRAAQAMCGLLIALLLLTAVSAFSALDPNIVWVFFGRLLMFLLVGLILIYVPFPENGLTAVFGLFLLFQGGIVLAQYWTQGDIGLQWLGELELTPEPGYSVVFGSDGTWLRGYGLSPHPNIIGGFLASAWLIVLPFVLQGKRPWSYLAGLVGLLGLAAVCVTFSRSAWLGLACGASLYALCNYRTLFSRKPVMYGAALAVVLALFAWQAQDILFARFAPLEGQATTQSIGERALLADTAWRFIDENGFFGMGAGNFGLRMLALQDEIDFPSLHPVHNVPLLLTAELGWLGGATWLALMFFPIGYTLYTTYQGNATPLLVGVTAALLSLAMIDFFDHYSWGWTQGRMWRFLLFALWVRVVVLRPPLNE